MYKWLYSMWADLISGTAHHLSLCLYVYKPYPVIQLGLKREGTPGAIEQQLCNPL